jgi:hypothetical protein
VDVPLPDSPDETDPPTPDGGETIFSVRRKPVPGTAKKSPAKKSSAKKKSAAGKKTPAKKAKKGKSRR